MRKLVTLTTLTSAVLALAACGSADVLIDVTTYRRKLGRS
jgi:hypothetical protein